MVIRNTIEQTVMLELLPGSQIDVYVQVLQADGGTRCACINAAMLALADAGNVHTLTRTCSLPTASIRSHMVASYLGGVSADQAW